MTSRLVQAGTLNHMDIYSTYDLKYHPPYTNVI